MVTAPVSTPPEEGVYVGYSFPTSLPVFVAVYFLDGPFDKNEMESQGTFNLHSLNELSEILVGHLYFFFRDLLTQFFNLFISKQLWIFEVHFLKFFIYPRY